MHFSILSLSPLLLYSAKLSSAYFIHSSCSGKDIDRDKLKTAIDTAVDYAVTADENWDKDEVKDLKSWLFGSSSDDAKSFFTNILSDLGVVTETTDSTKLLTEKVVFFCSTSVLQARDDPKKPNPNNKSGRITSNTAVNIDVYGDGIQDCEPTSGVSGVKAFTARQNGRSYIMLCPWYLQKMKVVKVSTTKAFTSMLKNPLKALDKGLDKIIPDGDKTPMDTMSLLEQTVLHELTHTTYAGHAEDIDGGNSYDWKNVIRLSSQNGQKNAESLAFFGLGAYLISQGYQISQNGDIKKP